MMKIGSVVRLNSESDLMTVSYLRLDLPGEDILGVTCVWFNVNSEIQLAEFRPEMLTVVTGD